MIRHCTDLPNNKHNARLGGNEPNQEYTSDDKRDRRRTFSQEEGASSIFRDNRKERSPDHNPKVSREADRQVLDNKNMENPDRIKYIRVISRMFSVLGHAHRVAILDILNSSPVSFSELEKRLKIRPGSVSNHLKRLKEAGLIEKSEKVYVMTEVGELSLSIITQFFSIIDQKK